MVGLRATETLPVLNLGRINAESRERQSFLVDLREAAREYGFFYVAEHGIPPELIRDLLDLSRRFFTLPEAEKLAIEMINSPQFRGYTRAGWEHTRGLPDWREQLDVGAELPARQIDRSQPSWTRLQGPNQWPAALPELRQVLLRYLDAATALAIRITRVLAESLEQPEDIFEPIYTPVPNQLLKIIRYPGRSSDEGDQGVGPHKDSGFVTVLLQDVTSGLQVDGDGGWIEAVPRTGTIVANIGELLEMASNGYFRANVHRVVSPPKGSDRLSVAFFMGARLDAIVPTLNLPLALATQARGLTQDPLNPLFREVGRNYLKSRLRSHPDVARRHHADLLTAEERQGVLAAAYAY